MTSNKPKCSLEEASEQYDARERVSPFQQGALVFAVYLFTLGNVHSLVKLVWNGALLLSGDLCKTRY